MGAIKQLLAFSIGCIFVFSAHAKMLPEQGYAVLVPEHKAQISSEIMAKIQAINVKDAGYFNKDDILIAFDCRTLEADHDIASNNVESAKTSWESAKALEELESGSLVEVAEAKAQYQAALAQEKSAAAILDRCSIKAPFSGRVEDITVNVAEVVQPGAPLMSIIDHDNLKIKLFVPSKWLDWLKVGKEFFVQFHEASGNYRAIVTKMGASVDAASQTIKIYGKFLEHHPELLNGMSGEAYFIREVKNES